MEYNKLVRDKIPEIIKKDNKESVIHIAGKQEYFKALIQKLNEEVKEFIENPSQEEMADILEVIDAICEFEEFKRDEINKIKNKKKEERGGFGKRIILDETK